jgi:hypothetical protein
MAADTLSWYHSSHAFVSDDRPPDALFSDGGVSTTIIGAMRMPYDSTGSYNAAAALPRVSGAGRNSPRFFIAGDSGLVILDAKANDNVNGFRRVITTKHVGPMVPGDVRSVFSAGFTTDQSFRGYVGVFDTLNAPQMRVVDATSPAGLYAVGDSIGDGLRSRYTATGLQLTGSAVDSGLTLAAWVHRPAGDAGSMTFVRTFPKGAKLGVAAKTWSIQLYDSATSGSIVCSVHEDSITSPRLTSQWIHVVGTYSGTGAHAGLKLYINGEEQTAFAVRSTLTAYTSMQDTAKYVEYAKVESYDNRPIRMASAWIAKGVLSSNEIREMYRAGQAYIESPTPDTLTVSSRLRFAHADWLSGRVVVGDSARAEVRDRTGALIDTFLCSGCGQLFDAKLERTPSADSLALWMVGATGTRRVGMNQRLYNFAAAEWPREEFWVGRGPVVADSSGTGHVWKIQDAIDAAVNVSQRLVRVMRGYYPDPVTSVSAGITIEGSGPGTVIGNANLTTSPALTVAGDSVTVRNLTAHTATGAAGGNQNAVTWSGNYGKAEDLTIRDADDDGLSVTGRFFSASRLNVADADDHGILIGGGRAMLTMPVFSSGATSMVFGTAGDSSRVIGGDGGDIHAQNGAVKISIVGTNYGVLTDIGSGITEAGNP